MAVIAWQKETTPFDGGALALFKWLAMAAGDTGQPISCGAYPDKTVHVLGTFGGTVTIQGTLDPAAGTYATLNDPQGNALTYTAEKIENVLEHVYLIRPSVGAGAGPVDVWLLCATGGR